MRYVTMFSFGGVLVVSVILCFGMKLVECGKPCPVIVKRSEWDARIPMEVDYAIKPVKYVIVHHTVTSKCESQEDCSEIVKNIQDFHLDQMEFHDIGYNFLVGGDGKIYEGAGFHKVGAHTRGYNSRSLGLAFIGNFNEQKPNTKQLNAAKDFLECSIDLGELSRNYKIFGARQLSATQSPGLKLYHELQRWSHYSSRVPPSAV